MDYCSTCRRHLNGALVCPGCGAYAPDIAPPVVVERPGPDRSAGAAPTDAFPAAPPASPPAAWDGDGFAADAGDLTERERSSPGGHAGTADAPSARPGRAARRRQLARLKKHQRRAMVATAFALVGGGLSVATLDRDTTDRAQAATAPDDRTMGGTRGPLEEEPDQQAPSAAPHTAPEDGTPAAGPAPRGPAPATPAAGAPAARPDTAAAPRTLAAPERRSGTDASSGTSANTSGASGTSATSYASGGASAGDGAGAGGTDGTAGTTGTTGTTASSGSGTAAEPAPDPAAGGTESGTTGTSPATATTSPTQLCLLGLCLG
ncbi:SCO2400 family protein [Streptomyces sp. bgisy154]|uniref:SCO2400 family protein n=1 Tax=Streptomyces sp. bgisy154 TaxID=3413794 RepID=UPI003D7430FF